MLLDVQCWSNLWRYQNFVQPIQASLFFCLSQEVNARLEGPSHPSMDRKLDIPTDDDGSTASGSDYIRSSAIYHTAQSAPLPFPNTPFSAITPPPNGVASFLRISPTEPDFRALFKNLGAATSRSCGSYCPCVQVEKTIFNSFSRVVD